jgi:hypothetical protein
MPPLPLVRVSGAFMRPSALSIAMTLILIPAPCLSFDEDEFCAAVTDIARRMNARKGKWLDRSTRHDGVVVDCEAKTVEAKRFLNADPAAMREGWQTRKQREWNSAYCNDEPWREAIENGWSVVSTLTFRTGDEVSFVAALRANGLAAAMTGCVIAGGCTRDLKTKRNLPDSRPTDLLRALRWRDGVRSREPSIGGTMQVICRRRALLLGVSSVFAIMGSIPTTEAASAAEIDARVQATLREFFLQIRGSRELVTKSAAVLVFPSVIKAGMGIGGEYGEGALLTRGRTVDYYNTVSASIGFQLGAQARSVIIVFMTL